MELLDHTVILCLVSWGITILFSSIVASWFYIPTNREQEFQFLHTLANICSVLLLLTILMGAGCYLIVVLICISLMINGVEQLFVCSLAICLSSLNKYLFKSFAYFQIAGFLLLSLKLSIYSRYYSEYLLETWFTNIFSDSIGYLFTLLIVFWCKVFILMLSNLSIFTFFTCAVGVISNESY